MITLRKMFVPLVLLLSLGTQLGNGCASDDGGSSSDGRYDDRSPQARPDDDYYADRGHPKRIPRAADVVREGNEKLLWRADMNGRYYVYDVTNNRIVHDAPIARGQELYVDPKRDRVSVDGKDVPGLDVKREVHHRIYFAATRDAQAGDDYVGPQRPPSRQDEDDNLPRGAQRLAAGRGNIAIHAVPDDGTVYVYDDDARRVLYQRDVRQGNSVQIFPSKDYVNVNSKKAADVRLSADGRYSLYFVRRK